MGFTFLVLAVWQALVPLYNSLEELKEKTWLSVQPRKLRQSLDELLAQLKQLPAKFRSYDSYNYAKKALQNYSKVNFCLNLQPLGFFVDELWQISFTVLYLRVNWLTLDVAAKFFSSDVQLQILKNLAYCL